MGTSGIDPLTFPQNMSPIAQTICLGHQINRRSIYLYSEYGKGPAKRNFSRVARPGPILVGGSGIAPITIPENLGRVAQTICLGRKISQNRAILDMTPPGKEN